MTTMTPMTGWDLFEDLRAAQDEMLRATRGRGWRPGQQYDSAGAAVWAPAVDISERKDAYLVTAELPGVNAGDVEITFEDGLLTIQGERRFARLRRGEDPPHRAVLRHLPPLDHPAQPCRGGQDRSHGTGRRAADHGAQGTRSPGQAHPGARRPGAHRPGARRSSQRRQLTPGRGRGRTG